MEQLYYCQVCRQMHKYNRYLDSYESYCPTCHAIMIHANISSEEWNAKNEEEKKVYMDVITNPRMRYDSEKGSASTKSSNPNQVARLLRVVAIIYMAICLVGGLIVLSEEGLLGIVIILGGFIFGLLLFGGSEVINLLQDIKDK